MRDLLDEEKRLPYRQPLFILQPDDCNAGGSARSPLGLSQLNARVQEMWHYTRDGSGSFTPGTWK